jgi:hypothetical protein
MAVNPVDPDDSYCYSDERCWCHGIELGMCPPFDGDEPWPVSEWATWQCPRCRDDVASHHEYWGKNRKCVTLSAEYLARPWKETLGQLPEPEPEPEILGDEISEAFLALAGSCPEPPEPSYTVEEAFDVAIEALDECLHDDGQWGDHHKLRAARKVLMEFKRETWHGDQ